MTDYTSLKQSKRIKECIAFDAYNGSKCTNPVFKTGRLLCEQHEKKLHWQNFESSILYINVLQNQRQTQYSSCQSHANYLDLKEGEVIQLIKHHKRVLKYNQDNFRCIEPDNTPGKKNKEPSPPRIFEQVPPAVRDSTGFVAETEVLIDSELKEALNELATIVEESGGPSAKEFIKEAEQRFSENPHYDDKTIVREISDEIGTESNDPFLTQLNEAKGKLKSVESTESKPPVEANKLASILESAISKRRQAIEPEEEE